MQSPSESERLLYEPPASGPLAGLSPDQIENLLLRAVLADLKAGGWDPASISNRSKCELGERLRRATGLPLRSVTAFLRISKSSYEYHRARLGADRDADIRGAVAAAFAEGRGAWGYRTVWARLRRGGIRCSEKRVRRVMREEGLEVVYARRRRRRWSSYAGEPSAAPPNLVARRFRAGSPDELWVTDITEFRLPSGAKAYLSAVVDCFDGMPVSWRVGPRPDAALADGSLSDAVARMRPGAHPTVHSDRGAHYRWPGWVAICEGAGLVRSMYVGQGVQPRQRRLRGLLRPREERVLPLEGLDGRGRRRVRGAPGRLPALLSGRQDQALPGLAEPGGVPEEAWIRRLGGPRKCPHPQENVRTPLSAVLGFQNAIGEIPDLCLRRSELRECEPVFFDTRKPPTSANYCHFDEEIRVGVVPQNS